MRSVHLYRDSCHVFVRRALSSWTVCACLSCVCICVQGELRPVGCRQQQEKLYGPAPRLAVLHHVPGTLPRPHSTHPHHGSPEGNAFPWPGCSAPARLGAALPGAGRRGRRERAWSVRPQLPSGSSTGSAATALSQEHPGVALMQGGMMGPRGASACSPPKSGWEKVLNSLFPRTRNSADQILGLGHTGKLCFQGNRFLAAYFCLSVLPVL